MRRKFQQKYKINYYHRVHNRVVSALRILKDTGTMRTRKINKYYIIRIFDHLINVL